MEPSRDFLTFFLPLLFCIILVIFLVRWYSSNKLGKRITRRYWLLKINPEQILIFDWWKKEGDRPFDEWHPIFYNVDNFMDWRYVRSQSFFIRKGDGVAIWLVGHDSGIYEIGEIVSKPKYGIGLINQDIIPYIRQWHKEEHNNLVISYRASSSFHSMPLTTNMCEDTRFLRYLVKDMDNKPFQYINPQQWNQIIKYLQKSNIPIE